MTSIFRRHSRGRPPHPDVLTPAEWRVLEEIREGRSNPEIAERLGLSRNTVKTHISSMLSKLELRDRNDLATWRGEPALAPARRSFVLVPFGWLTSKVAGGAAVAALTVLMVAGLVVAMESGRVTDDGSRMPPATVPTESVDPTASVEPTLGPEWVEVAPEFRDFASLINDAVERRDITFFQERAATELVVCSARDVERTTLTGCEQVGQEYEGLGLGYWRSDSGGLAPANGVMRMIEELWLNAVSGEDDEFGDATPFVYALGVQTGMGEEPAQIAVITAIVEGPGSAPVRATMVTHWTMIEGQWRFFHLLNAPVLGEEFLEPAGVGVESWVTGWERFQP